MEVNCFLNFRYTLTAIRIETARNNLCDIVLCLFFLTTKSTCAATSYEQISIHSVYSDLRQCYHSIDELDQALSNVPCFRTPPTFVHPMLLQELLQNNPNCVFTPFALHDADDAPQTTLWEAAIDHRAYSIFDLFLKSGADLTIEPRHAHFFELIRTRNSFYIMFLNHAKKTMHSPERVLNSFEERGLISADIKGLIRTFISSPKEYLQDYRLTEGHDTLLDYAIQKYLTAEFMRDPLVLHWCPLKLLCDLDIPLRRNSAINVLQEKVREDSCKMNTCLVSTTCVGVTLIAILTALVQPTALITVAPLEVLIIAPLAVSWYSRLRLLKHIREWKARRDVL